MQESYQVDPIRNFFDCFDAIYCVNLERRSDRWEKVMLEFAKIGISDLVVRHKAIETPDNGHIWCMLSHRSIVMDAKSKWLERVFIFEDDMVVRSVSHLNTWCQRVRLPEEYDLLYLGWVFWPASSMSMYDSHWFLSYGVWNTHAYSINQSFYDFFLSNIPEEMNQAKEFISMHWSFDRWLARNVQKKKTTYYSSQICFLQNLESSDIDWKIVYENFINKIDFQLLIRFPFIRKAIYRIVSFFKNVEI